MNLLTTNSDVTSERGFLSCVCKNVNNFSDALDAGVNKDWFTEPFHQKFWEAVLAVEEPSDMMDIDVMLSFDDQEDRDRSKYIAEACETSASYNSYFEKIKEDFYKRKLRLVGLGIEDALRENESAKRIMEKADKELTSIAVENSDAVRKADEVIDSMWADIQKRMECGGMNGIPSGLHRIDQMTNGWQPADLIVLAARTSVGKTAFGCELALNALKTGNKVLFFSLEMKAEAVMQRLVSNLSEVPLGYIVDKTAVQKDVDAYRQAMHWMRGKDFWIDDRGMINSAQVRAKSRKFARKGLDMIVVDYAQKMSALDPRIPREQQVAEIAGSMKNLAMELNIPVILLSQLNRGADELNRKPRLSDMRESGALEQDADLCALLWRKNDDPDETIISISKQRNGRCGDVEVCFKPKIQKFTPRPILS